MHALREALKIYDSRVWWGERQGNGLEQFGEDLSEVLVHLDSTLLREGNRAEAVKVEDQLVHSYKALSEVQQAAEVKKRRDVLLTRTNSASPTNGVERGGG